MANQIVVSSGAKVRDLNDVIIGTSGVLSSLAFNVANGVPKLDSNAKILVSQLPNSVMEYLGTWNAATNTPFLVNGTGNAGDVYLCNVAGTVDFGAGPISFVVSDQVIYSGSIWQKASGSNGTVTSIGLSSTGNDAITITGSPVTTSGTINLGFAGTNLQYINGAGDLTTFPTLISSIGLSMPSAFSVANSPLTANGTIAVTGAGYPSQYIRGDGTLADFPTSGGGGSSVSYYLNGGTSQGTIGGVTYYEMSKTADTGTMADFSLTGNGFIVAFLTDAGDPAQLNIPAGNWNYEIYASMSANGGTPEMYAELYKYDGTTFTLIATSPHEILYDGTALNLYTFAMTVPSTTLAITDRLAVKLYATNSGGKTTTVHTQDSHLCQIITTFSTGITALNGLTAQVQYFATGTSGTDFNISSTTATHTFNIPDASATNRGLITTGTQTIGGVKTFSNGLILQYNYFPTPSTGDIGLGSNSSGITITTKPSTTVYNNTLQFSNGSNSFLFPNATGTLALTSDLSSYVPYTGATQAVNLGAFDLTLNGVKIGIGAGSLTSNTIVGAGSLGLNTTGYENTAVGNGAMYSNTTGYDNVAVGYGSLTLNTSGTYNTSIGSRSLFTNTTGNNNTAIGNLSLNLNTTGSQNSALGAGTLTANTTGSNNVGIGNVALQQNTTGDNNTAIGSFSSYVNTTGANNTSVGANSLSANTTGQYNTSIGSASLYANTTGYQNTAIGYNSLGLNTTGYNNIAIGQGAGNAITTGSNNTIVGAYAGTSAMANNIVLADGQGNIKYRWDGTNNNLYGNVNFSSTIGNGTYTYTLPSATGTLALTSDLTGYVTLATAQTITGLKKFDASLLLKDSATISTTSGYLALNFVKATTQSSLYLTSDTGFTSSLIFNNAASYNYTYPAATGTIALGTGTTNYHAKWTGTNTIGNSLIFDNGTNVGIGNTNTSYTLDVSGTGRFNGTSASPLLSLTNTTGGTLADFTITENVGLIINSYEGATARSIDLKVAGTSALLIASTGAATFSSSVTISGGNDLIFRDASTYISSPATDTLRIITANTERMRITSAGNVGIGTASPLAPLQVNGNFRLYTSNGDGNELRGIFNVGGAADPLSFSMYKANATTIGTFITSDGTSYFNGGNVGIGTTGPTYQLQLSTDSAAKPTSALWTIASDERIKENINPYKKGLQELLKINPITYDYNGLGGFVKGKGGVGIIAQEIIDILPDSVSSIKAKLNETDEDETNILNFNGHELIYVLINSIKEQQAIITSLQDRLDKAGL